MSAGQVLVATEDPPLRASVQRLAAVAGVSTQLAASGELRARWPSAAAVVVDPATARWCVRAALPRRGRLLLVTSNAVDDASWPLAVAVGADAVHPLPRDERQVADWLAVAVEPEALGRTVACVSARGGAGASTLAAALGLAAGARGEDALLVDADPWSAGIDFLLGVEDLEGARWDALADTSGVLPAVAFAQALPAVGRLRILSGTRSSPEPLRPAAVEAALGAGRRAGTVLIADLPRGHSEVAALITACADTVLIVVPGEVRAVAAASSAVAQLAGGGTDVRIVVREPGPGGLRPRDVCDAVGAPLAAVWPWERRLAQVVERGRFAREWPRTRVGGLAGALVDELTVAQP